MGLFDIFKRSPKQIIQSTDKGMYGNSQVMQYWTPPSALLTTLGITANASQMIGDPRAKLVTYQTMVAVFPEVYRMLCYHLDIMGSPEIESDDQVFEDEANAMLNELKWRGQLDYEGNQSNGLDSLIRDMAFNTLSLGQSFYTLLDQYGLPATTSRQKVEAIQLHSSNRFIYNEWNTDQFRLEYTAKNRTDLDRRIDQAFQSVRFGSHPDYPWGMPLLYNAERVAMEAAILLEMQLTTYREKAAAPRMTVISVEPTTLPIIDVQQTQMLNTYMKQWGDKTANLEAAYADAKRSSNTTGKGTDIVASIVGKIDVSTHSSADMVQPVFSYPSDIKLTLQRLVIAMLGSPDLVGLSTGGDGQGSSRSEIQMDAMVMYAQGLRSHLEPHVKRIFETQMIRLSRRIPAYSIEWGGLSTHDLKAKADREKVEADTQKVWVDSLTTLLGAGELVAAQQFAIDNDIEWFMPELGTL